MKKRRSIMAGKGFGTPKSMAVSLKEDFIYDPAVHPECPRVKMFDEAFPYRNEVLDVAFFPKKHFSSYAACDVVGSLHHSGAVDESACKKSEFFNPYYDLPTFSTEQVGDATRYFVVDSDENKDWLAACHVTSLNLLRKDNFLRVSNFLAYKVKIDDSEDFQHWVWASSLDTSDYIYAVRVTKKYFEVLYRSDNPMTISALIKNAQVFDQKQLNQPTHQTEITPYDQKHDSHPRTGVVPAVDT